MKALRIVPLVMILAACSSGLPLKPYRIDVQQGNALDQASVEKLRPGLSRSQVRFLLGTPLMVDPFHNNRWDYVYNYRKAGKLTEERRLALFFDGDVLVRIEGEGFAPKEAETVKAAPAEKPAEAAPTPAPEPAPAVVPAAEPAESSSAPATVQTMPLEPVAPLAPEPAPAAPPEPAVTSPAPAEAAQPRPVEPVSQPKPATEPAQVQVAPARPVPAGDDSLGETSVVAPLNGEAAPAQDTDKTSAVGEAVQEPLPLQTDTNVESIKTDD